MTRGRLRFSARDDGDFAVDGNAADLKGCREQLAPGSWTWLRQVHGARVVEVDWPGEHAGTEADAAVTSVPGAVLAVHTADCLPLLVYAGDAVGAAHVGWRGLVAGVVEATLDALSAIGGNERAVATIGPHIRARCYEFSAVDLAAVADRYGPDVRATTAWGAPALDLHAGVLAALDARDDVWRVETRPGCTACEPRRFFSHRARGDGGRHANVIALGP